MLCRSVNRRLANTLNPVILSVNIRCPLNGYPLAVIDSGAISQPPMRRYRHWRQTAFAMSITRQNY